MADSQVAVNTVKVTAVKVSAGKVTNVNVIVVKVISVKVIAVKVTVVKVIASVLQWVADSQVSVNAHRCQNECRAGQRHYLNVQNDFAHHRAQNPRLADNVRGMVVVVVVLMMMMMMMIVGQ